MQFYFQLQMLLTDKNLRHGSNLCTLIRKHLYGPLRKKIHIPIYQDIFTYIPQVYRWHIFIWTGSKTDLEKFVNELNTKFPSTKFEYEILKERISYLDTEIFIKNNKLHTKIFRKKTDRQTFLNIESEHPKSLKTASNIAKHFE